MDLNDVIYLIDGSIIVTKIRTDTPGVFVYTATLLDKTKDPCLVHSPDKEPVDATTVAVENSRTALDDLAYLISATSIAHYWPIQADRVVAYTRIPPGAKAGWPKFTLVEPEAQKEATA